VVDKAGAFTLISSQVTTPFSTHILIDGYDNPNPAWAYSHCPVRSNLVESGPTLWMILWSPDSPCGVNDKGVDGGREFLVWLSISEVGW